MPEPVVHHLEVCVCDALEALDRFKKFGFQLFAKRITPLCKQFVLKHGEAVFFVITERQPDYVADSTWKKVQDGVVSRAEPLTTLCCEDSNTHEVDTVFNLAFSVKK
ncbi:4-hydroxyphenylpyruvate dioxygenase-like protein [Caerostris extrusa]|uniref:4-hydroxyphenylpyruvate dioxygenase-like protein n=1 Tax=Caerostris extrusa TaxID=172846 RepID=A0AAV4VWY5_CAEEX|nr:4-hydroxyphenylpyruvate dioxygenase-like protein [Caerostris extrusa]